MGFYAVKTRGALPTTHHFQLIKNVKKYSTKIPKTSTKKAGPFRVIRSHIIVATALASAGRDRFDGAGDKANSFLTTITY